MWDWVIDLAADYLGNASASKTKNKRFKVNWDNLQQLVDMQLDANRVGKQDLFTSWDWDEDKKKITQSIINPGMQQGFDEYSNWLGTGFEPMKLPDQMGSIWDASLANRMQRQGILDETTMPNLTQENYGTRVGDQYRDSFFGEAGNSFTGGDGTDPDETVDEDTTFFDEPNRVGGGEGGMGVGDGSNFLMPGLGPIGGGNTGGLNDAINEEFGTPLQGTDLGWAGRFLLEHGGDLGTALSALSGIPGGRALAGLVEHAYFMNNQLQSPNNGPALHPDSAQGNTPNNSINDAINQAYPPNSTDNFGGYNIQNPGNNSGFYQGGAFNPAAGGGLGGGMGGFGGGFGGSMSGVPVVGGSWRSSGLGGPDVGGAWADYSPGQNPYLLPLGGDNNTE